jgi:hypothetical protein
VAYRKDDGAVYKVELQDIGFIMDCICIADELESTFQMPPRGLALLKDQIRILNILHSRFKGATDAETKD